MLCRFMVTTITESFLHEHLQTSVPKLVEMGAWLTLKAASGLQIPYLGYMELDVEVRGEVIPGRGILVVKDTHDASTHSRGCHTPGLLGMNIIQECRECLGQGVD